MVLYSLIDILDINSFVMYNFYTIQLHDLKTKTACTIFGNDTWFWYVDLF